MSYKSGKKPKLIFMQISIEMKRKVEDMVPNFEFKYWG